MSKLTYDTNMASGVFGSRIRRVMMPVIMVIVCIIPMFVLCPPVTAGSACFMYNFAYIKFCDDTCA